MKASLRYVLVFAGVAVGGVYLHEFGHVLAAWAQGIAGFLHRQKNTSFVLR